MELERYEKEAQLSATITYPLGPSQRDLLEGAPAASPGFLTDQDTPSAPSGSSKAQRTGPEALHLIKEVKNW